MCSGDVSTRYIALTCELYLGQPRGEHQANPMSCPPSTEPQLDEGRTTRSGQQRRVTERRLGDAEGVDELAGVGAQPPAQGVDLGEHRLGSRRGQPAVLLEPAPLGL